MNGADPLVSITVSAALGIVVVGMTIAYLINKWRRKDDTRNAAQNGGANGQNLPIRGGGGFIMHSNPATRMEPIRAKERHQMMSSVMPPEGSDVVMTKLLMSSNGNGASNGGGGGSQAAGGPAAVASGVGGASLMATGNTHHLFDSAPPIQDDPFAQSSSALTAMITHQGNASHPAEEQQRGFSNKMENNGRTNNWLNSVMARTMVSS